MQLNDSILNSVQTFDNILEDEHLQTLINYSQEHKWGFQTSNGNFESESIILYMLINDSFLQKNIKQSINKKLNLDDFVIDRMYLNGQFFGMSGHPHFDSPYADDCTLVVYLNEDWDYSWSGQTVFFDSYIDTNTLDHVKNSNNHKSIFPSWNTGIFFPGNIFHFAESPSVLAKKMRLSLAIKFKKNHRLDVIQ